MRIKIKALDDIDFVSARLDIENATIHIEAINLLDLTGKDCIHEKCSGGKYIAHGYSTSVYEDLHVDGYRVLIHLKSRRVICPVCGSVDVLKPACLHRKITSDRNLDPLLGNHRMTNRYLDWIEYLIFKYGIKDTSEMTGIKPRRLYYIREAYDKRDEDIHFEDRTIVVAKSRHNRQNLYLIIDTMYNDRLLNYFISQKSSYEYVKRLKQQTPAIKYLIIPETYKFRNQLENLFGAENVKTDFRSLQPMITTCCFNSYRRERYQYDSETIGSMSIEEEERLFRTPRNQLSNDDQINLEALLDNNADFHEYYFLQREYWYPLDDKISLDAKSIDRVGCERPPVFRNKKPYKQRSSIEATIDTLAKEVMEDMANNERKEYTLYKMKNLKDFDKEEPDFAPTISLNVDQEDAYE